MFGGRAYKIATIGGIPVRVDSSWIFIALFVVYSLVVQYTNGYGMQQSTALPLAIFTAFLFFGSILGHELSSLVSATWRSPASRCTSSEARRRRSSTSSPATSS
jgi:hypothetical protein